MEEINITESFWYYFLALEKDLETTARYVEPSNQDNVYSIEFYKILVLAATECESAFKVLCQSICRSEKGNIGEYKATILSKYAGIVNAEVIIPRAHKTIKPFDKWDTTPLDWWDAYVESKHNHIAYFSKANYLMALKALGALYILVFYLGKARSESFRQLDSVYFKSEYTYAYQITEGGQALP